MQEPIPRTYIQSVLPMAAPRDHEHNLDHGGGYRVDTRGTCMFHGVRLRVESSTDRPHLARTHHITGACEGHVAVVLFLCPARSFFCQRQPSTQELPLQTANLKL